MVKLTPVIRIILTGLAAAISVVAATADALPLWAQAVIVGASTILAGFGIVPPHVPVVTTVVAPQQPPPTTPTTATPVQAGNP